MNLSFRKVATLFLSGWIWIFFAFPGHGMEEGSSHAGHDMEEGSSHAGHDMEEGSSHAGHGMEEGSSHAGHDMEEGSSHAGHDMEEGSSHAGHGMEEGSSHAGHDMEEGSSHAGHDMEEGSSHAGHDMEEGSSHAGHGMEMDELGMVMNENLSELPRGCASVVGEESLTIVAGKEFAYSYPGTMFGYDKHEWHVAPCTRLTVTLINRDQVRHQWMIHGLPRYLYPMGMFTIEVNGPGERAATFIVPPGDRTYLVHCDVPHHMEKGMKAQLVVGEGSGDLPSIPGISKPLVFDHYPTNFGAIEIVVLVFATVIGAILFYILATRRKTSSSSLSKG